MSEAPLYDVFVSYAEADRAWVEGYLFDALGCGGRKDEGGEGPPLRCHSELAFTLGAPRLAEFERAIRQSRHVLLIVTPAYLSDNANEFTDLLAQSYGLETATWPVIPLMLRPAPL